MKRNNRLFLLLFLVLAILGFRYLFSGEGSTEFSAKSLPITSEAASSGENTSDTRRAPTQKESNSSGKSSNNRRTPALEKTQYYYSKDDVCDYIVQYGILPENYRTKREMNHENWQPAKNSTLVVGGDIFGNREKKLPQKKGRTYYEADLREGYGNGKRGTLRIVFSNDGWIFYTEDHYEHFETVREGEH